ncbi:MAG TPA: transketolase C-terminal domain-containing protein [Candidatus Paceibacterota bacterium]
MIVNEQKLNPKVFDKDVEQEPIRAGFGRGLLEAGERDPNVVGLCADLTESTQMHHFANKFPKRFIQVGVAEQNLVTVASGLAHMGKIPFCSSYAMFSPGRNWEQIRTTITYNNVPVKIVGSHAGISVGPDGGTHQAIEDIALMRVLPRMVVVAPADAIEARKATLALAANGAPSYLRLAREKTPIVTTLESPFELGKANLLWQKENPEVAIIACGSLVHNALMAASELWHQGTSTLVINLHTIKPLDAKAVLVAARLAGAVVTVEEHQVAGGMGSAVAEVLARFAPVPMEFVGVEDQYGQSGEPAELLAHFGMDVKGIMDKVRKVIKRKK